MALPGVKINIENGRLGRTLQLNDGVAAVIANAKAVAGKMELDKAYAVVSLADAEQRLGLTAGDNDLLHSVVADYYAALGGSAPLYVLPVGQSVAMDAMVEQDNVAKLQAAAKGSIRLLGITGTASAAVNPAGGLDTDVDAAVIKGQETAEYFTRNMQPLRIVVDAKNFNNTATSLKDYNTATYNRCCLFLGNEKGKRNNRIGLLLGALSAQPVQRKVSRVRNGPIPVSGDMYIGTPTVEEMEGFWGTIHDRGFVFPRTFVGKSGYFFSSDRSATANTDDFSSLARGRVIDKALLIAYSVYVDRLDEVVQLDEEGKILAPVVTEMESTIESAISSSMLEAISAVEAVIPKDQNLLTDDTLRVSLNIVPVAYTSSIEVSLGFDNPLINN